MIKICITIEGSDGLTWSLWKSLVETIEGVGFHGLYRSDHLIGEFPPYKDALELWISLTWLADNTEKIEFGPLVSPLSFRHPVLTAKMAAAVDDLSNGRLVLGLGSGGWEQEHQMYGFELLGIPERLERFREGIQIIHSFFRNEKPIDYSGKFYQLRQAVLLPRPIRVSGPTLLIGGLGKKYTLPLVARYADEWNGVYLTPEGFQKYNQTLDELAIEENRAPSAIKRSILTGCVYGKNRTEVNINKNKLIPKNLNYQQESAIVMGNSSEIADQIGKLADVGVEKVMLVWYDLNDLAGLERMGKELIPYFS